MKRFSYCERCGEAVPVFENGLCAQCFTAELDAARTEPRPEPRPAHINSGLKVCSECGVRAAAVRGMCTICYKRAQHAALTPEQRDARKAKTRAANKRRKAAKLAANTTDSLM